MFNKKKKTLPWMETAIKLNGTTEIPGSKHNEKIMSWADAIGGWVASYYTNDEIPWCGLFVAHCLREHGCELPKNPLSALAYKEIGKSLTKPSYGAIMVFTRKGGGHVGFYVGEDDTTYHILGGNQSNAVNIARLDKTRLVGIRWPKEYDVVETGPVYQNLNTSISQNEA